MKPHIRLSRKVWDCKLPNFLKTGVIGFGWTPRQAYDDWRRNQAAALHMDDREFEPVTLKRGPVAAPGALVVQIGGAA